MTGYIVSFSFYPTGATERDFAIYASGGKRVAQISLGNGSALVMKPGMQHTHEHSLPPRPKITTPRINVTLRQHPEPNPQTGQQVTNPQTGQHVTNPQTGQHVTNPQTGQQVTNPQTGQQVTNPQTGQQVSNPQTGQQVTKPSVTVATADRKHAPPTTERGHAVAGMDRQRTDGLPTMDRGHTGAATDQGHVDEKFRGVSGSSSRRDDVAASMSPPPAPECCFEPRPGVQSATDGPLSPKATPAATDGSISPRVPDTSEMAAQQFCSVAMPGRNV